MKNIYLFLFLFFAFKLNAQGNLQFNQVKLVDNVVQTVPSQKAWKIESITFINGLSHLPSGSFTITNDILINGVSNTIRSVCGFSGNGASYGVWEQSYPIWLPQGTTLAAGSGVRYISVIEFNLIP